MIDMSLFEITRTNIVLDGQKVNLPIEEIFNHEKYQHFIGVTYSCSPRFINQFLKGFETVEIVVGIPEESHLQKANAEITKITYERQLNNVLESEPPKFFRDLSPENQEAFQQQKFKMWAASIGYVIHSKFYLLWNVDKSNTRLIFGSANLSNQAFSNQINQLEEVLIFDNNDLFEVMKQRYVDDISQVITPYFPKNILNVKSRKKVNTTNNIEAVILTSDDLVKLKEEQIKEKLDDITEKVSVGVLPIQIYADIKELPHEQTELMRSRQDQLERTETIYELSKEIVSSPTKNPRFKNTAALTKSIKKKITLKITQQAASADIPERPILFSSPNQRDILLDNSGLFIENPLDKEKPIPYGKKATLVQIQDSFKVIHKLLANYETYTLNYEPEYGSRIYEALLYIFTAPFIYELKRQAKTVESAHDIPQFLFLGGNAGSGKSSLLRVLSKMTKVSPECLAFVDYDDILPKNEHHRKSKIIQQIISWIQEENVAPLLIDEIPNEFFTKETYGEELIVNNTNHRGRGGDPFPVFIGTTNTENYSLPERAARRSYYLKIDKPFDEEFRGKTNQAYNDLLKTITTDLYQDFVLRFAQKLDEEISIWELCEGKGKIDFLYYTREIFKEYYALIEQPLPVFFPSRRFDDSQESNQEKWRKLYLGSSREDFYYQPDEQLLIFKITSLDNNLPLRYGEVKPSVLYKKALPPKVVIGSLDSMDIELYADRFFEWIGVENPYKKKSWLKKVFKG